MTKSIKRLSAIVGFCAASALTAQADLNEVVAAYQSRGWQIHDIESRMLMAGQTASLQVYLNRGDRMIARGEAADAVRDLDVKVFRPDGRLLKQDTDHDATPYVPFTAPESGYYTVEVSIYELRPGCIAAEAAVVLAER